MLSVFYFPFFFLSICFLLYSYDELGTRQSELERWIIALKEHIGKRDFFCQLTATSTKMKMTNDLLTLLWCDKWSKIFTHQNSQYTDAIWMLNDTQTHTCAHQHSTVMENTGNYFPWSKTFECVALSTNWMLWQINRKHTNFIYCETLWCRSHFTVARTIPEHCLYSTWFDVVAFIWDSFTMDSTVVYIPWGANPLLCPSIASSCGLQI